MQNVSYREDELGVILRMYKVQQHFEEIAESLEEGSLVFFLGSGINLSDNDLSRYPEFPPSDQRIAAHLKEFRRRSLHELTGFPCEICPFTVEERPQKEEIICPVVKKINAFKLDKPQLIQEQALTVSKLEIRCQAELLQTTIQDIRNELNQSTTSLSQAASKDSFVRAQLIQFYKTYQNYRANSIQEKLVHLYTLLRKMNRSSDKGYSFPLIITTNYDCGLEKAFEKEKHNINIMYYSENWLQEEEVNKFQVIQYKIDKSEQYKEINLQSDGLNSEQYKETFQTTRYLNKHGEDGVDFKYPLILKLYGGVLYNAPINQYTFAISQVMPPKNLDQLNLNIKEHLKHCDILFLGYSVTDPELRQILNVLCPDRQDKLSINNSKYKKRKGWLIHQSIPGDPKDQTYWQRWGVKLNVECSWEEYMEKFEKYFHKNIDNL